MSPEPVVYIVDDDEAARNSLHRLMETVHLKNDLSGSAAEFLQRYDPDAPACLVLDVRMPGMSGLALMAQLRQNGVDLPTVVVTGHADVPMAVQAMKLGAVDFVEKPYEPQTLLDHVHAALRKDADRRTTRLQREELRQRLAQLSTRERQVLDRVLEGKPNKLVAAELGVSQRTVDFHRAHLMQKLKARSFAELVRIASAAQAASR